MDTSHTGHDMQLGENDRESMLEGIAFLGDTLGPLFYFDPKDESVRGTYDAFASLNVAEAAEQWPFVDGDKAAEALRLMVEGVKCGVDDDLIWEYRRLFVGPEAKAAPPWGSVYTDKECVVFGESTLDLRQWMRERGIESLSEAKEPEDHIGMLLLLMSWIASNRPELVDEFLQKHLLTWSSHFLEGMETATTHPFYKGLAQITRLSLEGIQRDHEIEVLYPRYYR